MSPFGGVGALVLTHLSVPTYILYTEGSTLYMKCTVPKRFNNKIGSIIPTKTKMSAKLDAVLEAKDCGRYTSQCDLESKSCLKGS